MSYRIANGLVAAGITADDKIGLLSENHLLTFVAVLGIVRSPGVWGPVNARNAPAENANVLSRGGCSFLFVPTAGSPNSCRCCARRCRGLKGVLCIDAELPGGPALEAGPRSSRTRPIAALPARATWWRSAHGGTHRPAQGGADRASQLHDAVRQLVCGHADPRAAGAPRVAPAVACGGHAGLRHLRLRRLQRDPAVGRSGGDHRGDRPLRGHAAVPAADRDLPAAGAPRRARGRLCVAALLRLLGRAESADKLREALDVFGPVMVQANCQAEAPFICTVLGIEDHGRSSPILHWPTGWRVRARLALRAGRRDGRRGPAAAGRRARRDRGAGRPGDAGLPPDPEKTAEAMRHGWLHTGDVGVRDADGYYYIVDRLKDLIVSGGFNIAPSEVERVLWAHRRWPIARWSACPTTPGAKR